MICFCKFIYETLKKKIINQKQLVFIKKNFPSVAIENNVHFKGNPRNLVLGNKVVFQTGTVIHLGGMKWCDYKGYLEIGDESVISPNCVIYATGPGGIKIGKRFDCGPGVGIFASRTDYAKNMHRHIFAPVLIGDDVTVYANAVVSLGVKIGDGAVVAAGAIVINDVRKNTLVGGIPAVILREGIKKKNVRN